MDHYLAILLFAFSSTITPGPNNVMIMTSGVNYGVRKSLPHYFGICLGFPAMVVLAGLGFGLVFERFPLVHLVIKVGGIIYLFYLAGLIATTKSKSLETKKRNPLGFWQAVLFQWLNPKAWVMITGAVAAFTSLDGDIYSQILSISFIFFTVAFPCVGTWLFFGIILKRFLRKDHHQQIFNVAMALLLVASILPSLIELLTQSPPIWTQL